MKTLYSEESKDLKSGIAPNRFFILLFVLASSLSAQVFLNSFGRFTSTAVHPSVTNIIQFDIDRDNKSEIFCFGDKNREISIAAFDNNKLVTVGNSHTKINFTDIKIIDRRRHLFQFISRENKTLGVLTFSNKGNPRILRTKKFDSFPASLSSADIDDDRIDESVICGPSFNGLMLVRNKGNTITTESIAENKPFLKAEFNDLDYDGYNDIIALEMLSGSLYFFFNDRESGFQLEREMSMPIDLLSYQFVDFNLDGFLDVVSQTGKGFTFYYGDSVSSFSESFSIETKSMSSGFVAADFNDNGNLDIAYVRDDPSSFEILFDFTNGRKIASYNLNYPVIRIRKMDGIGGQGLLILAQGGNLYALNRFQKVARMDFLIPGSSELIFSLNNQGRNLPDLCAIDTIDNKISIIYSGKNRFFEKYWSFNLPGKFTSFISPEHQTDSLRNLFLFNKGGRMICTAELNLNRGSFRTEILYTLQPISDLNIYGQSDLLGTTLSGGKFGYFTFANKNNKFTDYTHSEIDTNVIASVVTNNQYGHIFYTKRLNDQLNLHEFSLTLKRGAVVKKILQLRKPRMPILRPQMNIESIDEYRSIIHYADNINSVFLMTDSKRNRRENLLIDDRMKNLSNFSRVAGKIRYKKNLNVFFGTDPKGDIFYSVKFDADSKKMNLNQKIENIGTRNFFVKSLYLTNYLLYKNNKLNTISIEPLND